MKRQRRVSTAVARKCAVCAGMTVCHTQPGTEASHPSVFSLRSKVAFRSPTGFGDDLGKERVKPTYFHDNGLPRTASRKPGDSTSAVVSLTSTPHEETVNAADETHRGTVEALCHQE